MTGNKIYEICIKPFPKSSKLTFRDSWMILLSPLDDLNKTFGLAAQPKGHFPHFYNKNVNLELRLNNLPPIDDYNSGAMKPEKRAAFLHWYEQNKHSEFVLHKELRAYCEVININSAYNFNNICMYKN